LGGPIVAQTVTRTQSRSIYSPVPRLGPRDANASTMSSLHHARRGMRQYVGYYHDARPHLSLDKDSPVKRPDQYAADSSIATIPQVGGLHRGSSGIPRISTRIICPPGPSPMAKPAPRVGHEGLALLRARHREGPVVSARAGGCLAGPRDLRVLRVSSAEGRLLAGAGCRRSVGNMARLRCPPRASERTGM
jgi:hypothetical protein